MVVLTTFDTDELVFDAIRAGAQAYLLKDAPKRRCWTRSARCTGGVAPFAEDRAQGDGAVPTAAGRRRRPAPSRRAAGERRRTREPGRADAREERILALIAEGKSNKEIARTVFLAEGTVKNYVSRIMEKLHARTRTELAVKALRVK